MISLARKIVDFVHDNLLERLVGALLTQIPLILISSQNVFEPGDRPGALPASMLDGWFGLAMICALPVGIFLVWAVGALANRRPHPDEPVTRNGFDAWRSPTRPVHPPTLVRKMVSVIGRGRTGITVWTLSTLGVAAVILSIWPDALDRLWADHPPRFDVWLAGYAAIIAAQIRLWAVGARTRLAAQAAD